ncbi:glycoside hydrolase family 43 protein [Conyzicola nivalis]|uniref:Glycoside hydrolase n=1 Tax=Conyzicola nivalis TaxID=1477021 RepID=A0A916SC05_9MICO|nr:glycoside hydrolase family 43 protein [Conyzicola nivalis]GGA90573.1 glycoside hydrolase [Conyzicola nivalis]
MRRSVVALVAVAVALAGCSSGGSGADDAEVQVDTDDFAIDQDFPDPDVLATGDRYYAFATNGAGFNVQAAVSTDLESWETLAVDVLPELPDWASPGKTWAPEVTEVAPGDFVMYFTAANKSPALQCIGVATATNPEGPFTPVGTGPIVCPPDEGGAIDAATFVDDDGTRYLLWKNDGNCCGLDTWLQIAPLSADGTAIVGETTKLLMQDQDWEGNLIEAPTLVKRDGVYTLLYSANDYGGDAYATGYATAPSALGPFTKADGPLLTTEISAGRYLGPGGQDVVTAPDGTDVLVFPSWDSLFIQRGVNVVPLEWDEGKPTVVLP